MQGGFKLRGRVNGGDMRISPGEFVDLDTLSSPLFGWQFYDTQDINDKGQIVGTGSRLFSAGVSAFILTLPPEE